MRTDSMFLKLRIIHGYLVNHNEYQLYRRVIKFLKTQNDPEYKDILKELRKEWRLTTLVGEYKNKYKKNNIQVLSDEMTKNHYINITCKDGCKRKMYFPQVMDTDSVREYCVNIMQEQDEESPHCYFPGNLFDNIDLKGTVIDCGVAEGNFTLEIIGKAEQVICFEPDKKWQDSLMLSLAPYRDKSVIVRKYVTNKSDSDDKKISLDDYFEDDIPSNIKLIKLDIEGAETRALEGMKKTLQKNPKAVLFICVYHRKNDYEEIKMKMESMGYKTKTRKGYMLFKGGSDFSEPYLRKGVLEAWK